MLSAITVSLVPETKGGPFVFSDGLAAAFAQAEALGFDGVEVFPRAGDMPELAAVPELAARHGRKVAAVGTGAGWVVQRLTLTSADAAVRARAREFVRGIVDAAGRLGAPAILGSMQGRWEGAVDRGQALAWLAEALEDLGGHAERYGVPLLYEPLNRYETNLLNRLEDTAAWLGSLRTRNVRILADLFHMNIDEADSAAALRAAGAKVGHVHFADSNRRAMGLGQTRIGPIVAALRETGYTGYLSAEVFPLPDAAAAAGQTIAAFRAATGERRKAEGENREIGKLENRETDGARERGDGEPAVGVKGEPGAERRVAGAGALRASADTNRETDGARGRGGR